MTPKRSADTQPDPLQGVHVHSCGAGPRLIFLHGWGLDGTVDIDDFEKVPELQNWRRTYVDLPGMGESEVHPELDSMTAYAQWLIEVLPTLSDREPFALIGTSTGAALALYAASSAPVLPITGLFLRMPRTTADRMKRAVSDEILSGDLGEERKAKVAALIDLAEARASTHASMIRNDIDLFNLNIPLSRVEVPTLIMAGRQDTRVGYVEAFDLVATMPHATYVAIDGAEHDYPYGDRVLFEALVVDWLRRVSVTTRDAR